jgi:hypothetical protein
MSYKKRKGFDPMGYAMENIALTGGVAGGSMMLEQMNTATGSHVDTGPSVKMLNTLPLIHATGGVFMGLNEMGKIGRKKKR